MKEEQEKINTELPIEEATQIKRIGLITSGGDCGGLNAFLRGAAMTALHRGLEVVFIPNGNVGMYNLVDFKPSELKPVDYDFVDDIDIGKSGSVAGNTRIKIKHIDEPQAWERVHAGMKKHKLDAIIICGGDGSGREANRYHNNGIKVIHAPKTMDLDLQCYSVGADSAINQFRKFLREVKYTGEAHNRIIIMKVFGALTGHTALRGGIAGDADTILIPEIPPDLSVVYEHMKKAFFSRVESSPHKKGTYIIVVAEGLTDIEEEHKEQTESKIGVEQQIIRRLTEMMKNDPDIEKLMKKNHLFVKGQNEMPEIRAVEPLYLARSGDTMAMDVNFGMEIGAGAVTLLLQGLSGVTVLGIKGNEVRYMSTKKAVERRFVDENLVRWYEMMGFCFGRKPIECKPIIAKAKSGKTPTRVY